MHGEEDVFVGFNAYPIVSLSTLVYRVWISLGSKWRNLNWGVRGIRECVEDGGVVEVLPVVGFQS